MRAAEAEFGAFDGEWSGRGRLIVLQAKDIGNEVEIVDVSGIDTDRIASDGVCFSAMATVARNEVITYTS